MSNHTNQLQYHLQSLFNINQKKTTRLSDHKLSWITPKFTIRFINFPQLLLLPHVFQCVFLQCDHLQQPPIPIITSDCTSTPSHPGTSARSANLKVISWRSWDVNCRELEIYSLYIIKNLYTYIYISYHIMFMYWMYCIYKWIYVYYIIFI